MVTLNKHLITHLGHATIQKITLNALRHFNKLMYELLDPFMGKQPMFYLFMCKIRCPLMIMHIAFMCYTQILK